MPNSDEQVVLEIDYDTEEAEKNVDDLTESIIRLEKENKSLRTDLKKTDEELAQENKTRTDLTKQMAKNQQQIGKEKAARKDNINVIQSEEKSINSLKAENAKLRKERDNTTVATEEGRKKIDELNEKINENNEIIKENTDALTQQKIGIGGYSDGIKQAVADLDQMPGATGRAANAGKGLLGVFKSILANPIGLILTLLVGTVALVTKAFKGTRTGSLVFRKGMADISSRIDIGLKKLGDFGRKIHDIFTSEEGIKGAFESAKESFSDWWQTVKTSGIRGALEKHAEAAKKLKNEVEELADLKKSLIDLKDTFIDIDAALSVDIANLNKLGDVHRTIADDVTKSFQDREAAAEKARTTSEQAAIKEIDLARQRFTIAQQEVTIMEAKGKFDAELIQSRTDAQVTLIEAEKAYTLTVRENERQRSELKQDRLERELDFIIDVFDSQKTVNEKLIADDYRTYKERLAILEETWRLADESFDQQIKNIEQFTDKQIDVNKLLELNNQQSIEYIRTLGLSEIIEGRALEIIKERRLAVSDLNEAETELNREMTERREAALERLSELNEEKLLRDTEILEEERDIRIEFETERYESAIENELLLDEELEAIELEHRLRLDEINKEYDDKQILRNRMVTDSFLDSFDTITEAAGLFKDDRLKLQDSMFKSIIKLNSLEEEDTEAKFALFSKFANDFTSLIFQRNGEQLEDLRRSKESELALAGDNEQAREAIEKKYAEKEAELKRRQFNQDKAKAIADTIIQTALAVTKSIAASPLTGGLPFSVIVGALGAAQTAIIAARKPPNFTSDQVFKKGGAWKGSLFGGRSHSHGGNWLFGTDGSVLNVEKGESAYILNKEATSEIAALSSINESHGGASMLTKSNYLQAGGQADLTEAGLTSSLIEALQALNLFVNVTDIKTGLSDVDNVIQVGVIE